MYSPKISGVLIGDLYRWAKSENVHMTTLVNRILAKEVRKQKKKGGDPCAGQSKTDIK